MGRFDGCYSDQDCRQGSCDANKELLPIHSSQLRLCGACGLRTCASDRGWEDHRLRNIRVQSSHRRCRGYGVDAFQVGGRIGPTHDADRKPERAVGSVGKCQTTKHHPVQRGDAKGIGACRGIIRTRIFGRAAQLAILPWYCQRPHRSHGIEGRRVRVDGGEWIWKINSVPSADELQHQRAQHRLATEHHLAHPGKSLGGGGRYETRSRLRSCRRKRNGTQRRRNGRRNCHCNNIGEWRCCNLKNG
mmetsp:Transcript_21764/g.61942  ORF Transcript_21764/g.61942 Transcript_21764/m.61942 type:complete len:246 (+) Transcript_21764:1474-2211(+)